jgi:hypothetical protein
VDQLLQHHAQGQYATVAEWLAQRRMGAQEKGPDRMAGPPGGNEAVLIPMYANNVAATTSISTGSQPPAFPGVLPLRRLVRAFLDCPLLLSAHFLTPAASDVKPGIARFRRAFSRGH